MAEYGISFVNAARVINQMRHFRDTHISEKRFVVSWDKSQADYGKFQEFGWRDGSPQPFIRPAKQDIRRHWAKIATAVEGKTSVLDDNLGDALLKEAARYGYRRARTYVPVDTGNLKESLFWKEL